MNISSLPATTPYWILVIVLVIIAVMLYRIFRRPKSNNVSINVNNAPNPSGGEGSENIGYVNVEAQKRVLSMWHIVHDLLVGYIIAFLAMIVAYFFVGLYILLLIPLLGIPTYFYTKKIYQPVGVPILVAGDSTHGGVQIRTYIVPYEQFLNVNTTGISNYIETRYGLGFLAEGFEFYDDNQRLVSKIDFAWIHWNHLNFFMKHKTFHALREVARNLIEENTRLQYLMDSLTYQGAKDMTKQRLWIIEHAKYNPELAETDQKQQQKLIEELIHKNKELINSINSKAEETVEESVDEAP